MNLHGILNKGQRRRRVGRGTAMAVAVGLAMMGGIATAVTASAHVPHVTTTCEALTVDLVNYQIDPGHKETFRTVHHDAIPETTHTVHHDAVTGDEKVGKGDGKAAWDEQVSNNDFRAPGTNHVVVTVNGTEVANTDFGTSYHETFPFVAGQSNTYKVVVTAWDDPTGSKEFTKTFEGTVQGCVVVTHPVTLPTVTPPTCDAAGIVTLPTSDFYTWVLKPDSRTGVYTAVPKNDYKLSGTLTFGPVPLEQLSCTRTIIIPVTPPVFIPGSCTAIGAVAAVDTVNYRWVVTGPATAPSYAAVAKNGEVLSGITTFGPFDLSQLLADSAACYVAPTTAVVPPKEVLGVVKNAPVKAAPVKAAPAPAVAPAVKTLAFTGAETVPLGLSGLLALVLGAVLTVASRRQRPKQARE